MNNTVTTISDTTQSYTNESATKRLKHNHRHHKSLLPGLPNHIAELCLSLVPPSILYSVCRSWRRLIYSPSFPPFLSLYALFFSTDQTHHSNSLEFSSFDPVSSIWHSLPPPPPDFQLRLLLRHPSFISRNLPIQSVSVSGNLLLLAATTHHFLPALSRPLIFSPISQKWAYGPPLVTPRRWCAVGTSRSTVYVASGIGSHYTTEVARSVEKWDLQKDTRNNNNSNNKRNGRSSQSDWGWKKMGPLKDVKFCREAIEAVGWRGKLCMVNVKGDSAKEGIVYKVENETWEDMPEGMLAGWRGPAAAMNEDTIYVVDESKGALRKYDPDKDWWEEVLVAERLRGAEHIAAAGGRVCVVCSGGVEIVVVDVVAPPPRLWVVDVPPGFQAAAIHILPRMSKLDL